MGIHEARVKKDNAGVGARSRTIYRELTTDVTSSNGPRPPPTTTSKSSSPTLHTSLDLAYSAPRSRSGDMYLVVPTTVRFMIVASPASIPTSSPSCGRIAETIPKSASLTRPEDETRTFAGWFFFFRGRGGMDVKGGGGVGRIYEETGR